MVIHRELGMEIGVVIAIVGSIAALYGAWRSVRDQFGWQSFGDLVVPRAAKWLLGLAVISTAIGFAAAWQVDRSNAGIHPEWIGMARRILSVEIFVSVPLFIVAMILVVRASKRAEEEPVPGLRDPASAAVVALPPETMRAAGPGVPTHVPEPLPHLDR